MRKFQVFTLTVMATLFMWLPGAEAQSESVDSIADAVVDAGYYSEDDLSGDDRTAIGDANAQGVAFVWIDRANISASDAPSLAERVRTELTGRGSQYSTVLVLLDDGIGELGLGAASASLGSSEIDLVINSVAPDFLAGDVAAGVTSFSNALPTAVPVGSQSTESSTTAGSNDSGGSGFFGLALLLGLIGGGLFLLMKVFKGRSKAKKEAEQNMEADRAEIKEQLKDNADRVISLGDKVILSKDDELIRTYEQASASYQQVSTSLAAAQTPETVDELDDKIDHAEWQFDVIEAKLEGKPVPLSPEEQAKKAELEHKTRQGRGPQDSASADRPALGRDESVFDRTNAPQPRRRSSSGGFGGGGFGGGRRMGGGLGGVLGSILMGGSLGGHRSSRRTRQRTMGGGGFSDPFGGAGRSRGGRSGGSGGGGFSRGGRGGGGFKR